MAELKRALRALRTKAAARFASGRRSGQTTVDDNGSKFLYGRAVACRAMARPRAFMTRCRGVNTSAEH